MENKKFTFEEFSDSGRFTSVEEYLDKNPEEILHEKCTDVIMYSISGHYIQVVKRIDYSEFYFDNKIRGYSLDEVELEVFKKIINK